MKVFGMGKCRPWLNKMYSYENSTGLASFSILMLLSLSVSACGREKPSTLPLCILSELGDQSAVWLTKEKREGGREKEREG